MKYNDTSKWEEIKIDKGVISSILNNEYIKDKNRAIDLYYNLKIIIYMQVIILYKDILVELRKLKD